jgi:hypothetical protein
VGVPVLGDTALNVAVKMTLVPGNPGFTELIRALAELAVKSTLVVVPIATLLMVPVWFAVPTAVADVSVALKVPLLLFTTEPNDPADELNTGVVPLAVKLLP